MIKIALLLGSFEAHSNRQRAYGVLRYAKSVGDWNVQVISASREFTSGLTVENLPSWRPDGLIVSPGRLKLLAPSLRGRKGPPRSVLGVVRSKEVRHARSVFISHDEHALTVCAAEHLLARPYAAIGCVLPIIDREIAWARLRTDLFRKQITARGIPFFVYRPRKTLNEDADAMATWLRALPKPCGLFALNDSRARHVLTVCAENGIKVPEEIAILGCDNNTIICESSSIPISSVEPDFEGVGFEAARQLDALIRTPDAPQPPSVICGVKRLVERASTLDLGGSTRILAQAREYIRRNAGRNLAPLEVAKSLHVSLRLLEKRFKETLGRTVAAVIFNALLDDAAEKLVKTEIPICHIPVDYGFKNYTHFCTRFKQRFGVTMSAYRAASRQASGLRPFQTLRSQMSNRRS